MTTMPSPTGYKLGVGVDSLSGLVRGDCVERSGLEDQPVPPAQQISFGIRKIDNVLDLAEALSVNLAASFSGGFGEVAGKAGWMKQSAVHDYSIYLLVSVNVANLERRMRDTRLKTEREDALKAGTSAAWQNFRKSCGDLYITGMRTGGQFYALYQLKTRSENEKEILEAHIRATGITGSWSVSADFSRSFERLQKVSELEASLYYEGPSTTLPDATKHSDILKFALEFPTKVQGSGAWEYQATYIDYDTLPNMLSGNPISLGQQKWVLEQLVRQDVQAKSLLSGIRYIQSNFNDFYLGNDGLPGLAKLEQQVIAIQKDINGIAASCYELNSKCELRPAGDLFTIRLPRRKEPAPIKNICSGQSSRFLTIDGGCKDLETGFVWSDVAPQPLSHANAVDYCINLTESGVSNWVLPTVNELVSISGDGGAAAGLRGEFNQWYWTSDQYRVNVRLGNSKSQDPRFSFNAICRRATN